MSQPTKIGFTVTLLQCAAALHNDDLTDIRSDSNYTFSLIPDHQSFIHHLHMSFYHIGTPKMTHMHLGLQLTSASSAGAGPSSGTLTGPNNAVWPQTPPATQGNGQTAGSKAIA